MPDAELYRPLTAAPPARVPGPVGRKPLLGDEGGKDVHVVLGRGPATALGPACQASMDDNKNAGLDVNPDGGHHAAAPGRAVAWLDVHMLRVQA